jgi:hypothetical protein
MILTQMLALDLAGMSDEFHEDSSLPIHVGCVDCMHYFQIILPHSPQQVAQKLREIYWKNWRRKCLSPGSRPCTDYTWRGYNWFSCTKCHTALWVTVPLQKMCDELVGGSSCTISNTSSPSHILHLPLQTRTCGKRVSVSLRLWCTISNTHW